MKIASRPPNWYLHPLVARQKRDVHLDWIRRHVHAPHVGVVLKTDLFEEAHGEDQLLFSLPFEARLTIGIDLAAATVHRAASRRSDLPTTFAIADTRRLPFRDGSVDVVISNSTLDHFDDVQDIEVSIREFSRVLKPAGLLLVSLDNPRNPLYLLRHAARPFAYALGRTAGRQQLTRMVEDAGLQPIATDWLIHNPRFLSTLLFLSLRRFGGRAGDRVVGGLLRAFATFGRLPTRSFTAAFVAVAARKK